MPPPSAKSDPAVWYCDFCGDGPQNWDLNICCPTCQNRRRDGYFTIETPSRHTHASSFSRHNSERQPPPVVQKPLQHARRQPLTIKNSLSNKRPLTSSHTESDHEKITNCSNRTFRQRKGKREKIDHISQIESISTASWLDNYLFHPENVWNVDLTVHAAQVSYPGLLPTWSAQTGQPSRIPRREPYTPERRAEVARIRMRRACIDCRQQRRACQETHPRSENRLERQLQELEETINGSSQASEEHGTGGSSVSMHVSHDNNSGQDYESLHPPEHPPNPTIQSSTVNPESTASLRRTTGSTRPVPARSVREGDRRRARPRSSISVRRDERLVGHATPLSPFVHIAPATPRARHNVSRTRTSGNTTDFNADLATSLPSSHESSTPSSELLRLTAVHPTLAQRTPPGTIVEGPANHGHPESQFYINRIESQPDQIHLNATGETYGGLHANENTSVSLNRTEDQVVAFDQHFDITVLQDPAVERQDNQDESGFEFQSSGSDVEWLERGMIDATSSATEPSPRLVDQPIDVFGQFNLYEDGMNNPQLGDYMDPSMNDGWSEFDDRDWS